MVKDNKSDEPSIGELEHGLSEQQFQRLFLKTLVKIKYGFLVLRLKTI
tara:strand:- start:527 stop:670 length:144 start_codon:yes stop_codon:yes gene_type:complete